MPDLCMLCQADSVHLLVPDCARDLGRGDEVLNEEPDSVVLHEW